LDLAMNAALPASMLELLTRLRRELWIERGGRALRITALVACATALATGLWHMLVGALTGPAVLALQALCIGSGCVYALLKRPAIRECAHWADRHLDGRSAYATLLFLARDGRHGASPAALTHLIEWADRAAARENLQRADRIHFAGLPQTVLLMALASVFGSALLALPGRDARQTQPPGTGIAVATLERPVAAAQAPAATQSRGEFLRAAAASVGATHRDGPSDRARDGSATPRAAAMQVAAETRSDERQVTGEPRTPHERMSNAPSNGGTATDRVPGDRRGNLAEPPVSVPAAALDGIAYGIARSDDARDRRSNHEIEGRYATTSMRASDAITPTTDIPAAPATRSPGIERARTAAERALVQRYLAAIGPVP
jgi:hypothetical protein